MDDFQILLNLRYTLVWSLLDNYNFTSKRFTWYCSQFLRIRFVVAGSGLYSYYILKWNKSDKQRKFVRKKLSFMHNKRFNTFLKYGCNFVWVQFYYFLTIKINWVYNQPMFTNYVILKTNLTPFVRQKWR